VDGKGKTNIEPGKKQTLSFTKELQLVQTAYTQKANQLLVHQKAANLVQETKPAARQRKCFQMTYFLLFTEVGLIIFLYYFVTSSDR